MILSEFVKFFEAHEEFTKSEVILEWKSGNKIVAKHYTQYETSNEDEFPDSDNPESEVGFYEYYAICFECVSIINENEDYFIEGEVFELTPKNSPDFIKDKKENIIWTNK
ncbi:hypothetical protein [Alkalihalobacillus sp. 1P02AB]|uniref:hypothetical protein n=1 Tax=Alkalihalobacillus sp. 1P02AB TaxID=3132260 RepID=UPI0039A63772